MVGPGEKADLDRGSAPGDLLRPGPWCHPFPAGVGGREEPSLEVPPSLPSVSRVRLPAWVSQQPWPSSAAPHTPFQLPFTPKRPRLGMELGMKRKLGTRLLQREQRRRHLALSRGAPALRGWNCVCSRDPPSRGPCRSQRDDQEASGQAGIDSGRENSLHVPRVSFRCAQAHSF